jgi:hypothetical protein
MLNALPCTFQHKPLVVAGQAMAYYGLRDGGNDVDLVAHPDDFMRLRELYPVETGTYGDSFIRIGQYECYDGFFGMHYQTLTLRAVEQEDRLIASLICLLYIAAARGNKPDARLIWQKLEQCNG